MNNFFKSSLFLTSLRIFVGLIFLISAVTKLLSIDNFELYIFSLNFSGFNFATLTARFFISLELVLGLLLILNLYFKIVFKISLTVLIGFSIFLITRIATDDNCNCFGSILPMNPIESLLKNIVFIILLLLIRKNKPSEWRYKKLLVVLIVNFSFAFPMISSPPDFLYNKFYKSVYKVDGEEYIEISDTTLDYKDGKKVIALFSMNCKYCILAAQKISIIAEKNNYKSDIFFYFFGTEEYINNFWEISNSSEFPYALIPFQELIQIAEGRLPTILFTENGKIIRKFGYRTFTEKDFYNFFNNN